VTGRKLRAEGGEALWSFGNLASSKDVSLCHVLPSCLPVPQVLHLKKTGRYAMPAKNPRVNIVVEPPIYGVMQDLAEHQGLSLSALAKVLITEALELREDAGGGLKGTEGIFAELSQVLPA
jgi:hypothetical protein